MTIKGGLTALIAAAVIGASANAASAADMSRPVYKAAPMAAPGFNWTGFYIGAVAGYAWGDADVNPTGPLGLLVSPIRTEPDGWLAGGTIGYNFQQGNLVLGTEGEFYWSNLEGSAGSPIAAVPVTGTYSNNWTGTLSTRLGVAFDTLLVYSKAGVAWANNDYSVNAPGLVGGYSSSISDTETGWLVGGGVEWAFARNWSAKIEGTYMDFGQKNKNFAPIAGTPITADIDAQISTVKFGINYRFY